MIDSPTTPAAPDDLDEGEFLASDESGSSDPEATLIDTLVRRGRRSRELTLSDDEEIYLVNRIIRDVNDAQGDIANFKNLRTDWIATWRGDPIVDKNFPFEGSANIRVPLTSSLVEQTKARILAAFFGPRRPYTFSSTDAGVSPEMVEQVNEWFDYELREVVNIVEFAQTAIHDICVSGIGLGIPRYCVEERKVESEHRFPIRENESITDQILTALGEIFTSNEDATPEAIGEGVYEVSYQDASDELRVARVEFTIEGDDLIAYCERPEIVFDGVRVEPVELEDIVLINSAPTIEEIPFFASRMWMLASEFERRVLGGYFRDFDKDDLDNILGTATMKTPNVVTLPVTISADMQEGTYSTDTTGIDITRQWIELYRWEGSYLPKAVQLQGAEVRRSGYVESEERVCVWIVPRARKVVKICRLEDLTVDGSRSPIKFDYIVQPGRFFSWSLVGWLRHVQAEIDMIHNQRLDSGLLSNVPFFFYVPTAGMQHTTLQLSPGKGYPIKDPNGVVFPRINWSSAWSFNEEKNVYNYGLSQAGLSPGDIGAFVSKRTTASEFTETQGASDIRMEWILHRLSAAFQQLFYRIFNLYKVNMRKGRVYQVSGLDGQTLVRIMDRETLAKPWKLKLTPNINQINSQLERDISVSMLSLLMNQVLIQLGIVKADTIYAAMERVVKASGYTAVPIHRPDSPAESDPPEVEAKQFIDGLPVRGPTQNENFGEHLQAHMRLLSDPNIESLMPDPLSRQALAAHVKATMTMQQMVALMRQQQAASAAQMQQTMNSMGIRPGLAGDNTTGAQAQPGEPAEMDQAGPAEGGAA